MPNSDPSIRGRCACGAIVYQCRCDCSKVDKIVQQSCEQCKGQILVFPEEVSAGIADLVRSTASAFLTSDIAPDKDEIKPEVLTKLNAVAAHNLSLPDLYPMKGILASTGVNLNDDFFDKDESYAARLTPIHKPFNFEHKSSDIIGHMTDCWISDLDGNVVTAEVAPNAFDIPFKAVLYRHFTDSESKQERIDKIIAAIENPTDEDRWFVSMECRFRGFDYLMFSDRQDVSNAKIIERNESTAFLTKHLRYYGGSGVYKGNKLARFLRNITFSAVGLVRNPGNPRSVILAPTSTITSGKIYSFSEQLGYDESSGLAKKELMNEQALKAELEALKLKLDEANKVIADTQKANWEKQVADLKSIVAGKEKEVESVSASVTAAKAEIDAAKTGLEVLTKENTELKVEVQKFKDEAAKTEAAHKLTKRLEQVKEVYGLNTVADAQKFVEPLVALTDEAFAAHLEVVKGFKVSTKTDNAKALETGTPVVEPDLNVGANSGKDEEKNALASELNEFFGLNKETEEPAKASKKTKVKK